MHLARYALSAGAALFLALSAHAQPVGDSCSVDDDCDSNCCLSQAAAVECGGARDVNNGDECLTLDGCDCISGFCDNLVCEGCVDNGSCESGCCASQGSVLGDQGFVNGRPCVPFEDLPDGAACFTIDGCDCESGQCIPCPVDGCDGRFCGDRCNVDTDCDSNCCLSQAEEPFCGAFGALPNGATCFTIDGCDCESGECIPCPDDGCDGRFCAACPPGTTMCDDPHMQGLRGQSIDWSGVDGGWYCLVTDDNANLHVNVRLTAPLPEEFPDRQLITGLSILSEGHSLAVEVANPYNVDTDGCPEGVSPCLADGGLRATVDGEEVSGLLRSSRHKHVTDGIEMSASNLPVECRQFGGDKLWVRMYDEMLQGRRGLLAEESFENWILRFDHMAAADWCRQYIAEHSLADLQSNHAIFKVVTSAATVRLNVGTNFQGNGELDWDGRVLPDLEFWQMDVGLHGLFVDSESLSGILGETARPVLDGDGHEVMKGLEALRGNVGDYRVSGPLGTDFAYLSKK